MHIMPHSCDGSNDKISAPATGDTTVMRVHPHGEHQIVRAHQAKVQVAIYLLVDRPDSRLRENYIYLHDLHHRDRCSCGRATKVQTPEVCVRKHDSVREVSEVWTYPRENVRAFGTATPVHTFILLMTISDFMVLGNRCHLRPFVIIMPFNGQVYLMQLCVHAMHIFDVFFISRRQLNLFISHALLHEIVNPAAGDCLGEVYTQHEGFPSLHAFLVTGDEQAKEQVAANFPCIHVGVGAVLHGSLPVMVIRGAGFLLIVYRSINNYSHMCKQACEVDIRDVSLLNSDPCGSVCLNVVLLLGHLTVDVSQQLTQLPGIARDDGEKWVPNASSHLTLRTGAISTGMKDTPAISSALVP